MASDNYIQELIVRDKMLKGIAEATQMLISPKDLSGSIQGALEILAKAVQVNRVYIFQNFTEDRIEYMHQSYEYVRNAKPQLANKKLTKLAYKDGYSRWYSTLANNEIISGNVADFPESEKPLLETQDILAIIVVPIFIKSEFWGFIGFDDCEQKRDWKVSEKSILITMAASFGSAIDRQKKAENLKESETLFRTLTEHLKSGVYTISETGKFLYANPEVLLISGYSKEEFIQLSFFDIVHPKFVEVVKERAFLRLQGKEVPESYEFIIVTKNGENRWVKVSNCRIFLANQPVILGTANDITERKIAEEELAKEKEQLAVTLRSIGDGVITTDKNGKVQLVNQAAERLTGWQQQEAFAKPFSKIFKIIDEKTGLPLKNPVEEVIAKKKTISLSNQAMLCNKKGEQISISDSAAPIRNESGEIEGVVLVFRNVTEEKKAAKVKETLLKIAISVTTSKNLTELYQRIHQELQILIPAKNFYIAILNEELNVIQIPYFVDEKMSFSNFSIKKSPVSQVIEKKKALLLYEKDIQNKIAKEEIVWTGTVAKTWLGVPLIVSKKTIGAVVVQDYQDKKAFDKDDKKILQFISEHIALAIEKMQVEKHLEESEEKYRLLFEAGNDGVLLLKNDECVDCNKTALAMFKTEKEKILGKKIQEFCVTQKDSSLAKIEDKIDLAYEKEAQFFECKMQTSKGKKFVAEIGLNPLNWKKRTYLLAIIRDISARKKKENHISDSLQEKETLLQEIHHRVKNNMQVISSMLNLQSSLVDNSKFCQMFKDSQNRVKTMALVHEKLYRTEDFSNIDFRIYVKDLVSNLFKSYPKNTTNISFIPKIDNVSFTINTAIPCGLIINELVTNALKYAFPDNRKGEIKLSITEITRNRIKLFFSDNGIGLPENVDMEGTKTLGLYLVKILTIQLNGEIEIERNHGTAYTVLFECEEKRTR